MRIEATAASVAIVKAFDVVYVLQDVAVNFVKDVLPLLPVPVVVLTGQAAGHQFWLKRGPVIDALLEHPKVAFWLAQNPTFRHRKYGPTENCAYGRTNLHGSSAPPRLGSEHFLMASSTIWSGSSWRLSKN